MVKYPPQGVAAAAAPANELFIPAPDPDTNVGTHPAMRLVDGQDVTVRIEFLVPNNFSSIEAAEIILVPGGTGNLRRSVSTNYGACGESYNTHSESIAAGEVAVTANQIECLDISAALTGIAAGDYVGIEFTRHGSAAEDTVDADCYFLGFRFRYS